METIAAIATAQSPSAIGIVRLSGEKTRRVLAALFTPASGMAVEALPYRRMTYGDIRSADGTLLDRGMAVCFSAAHSYTGEESAEAPLPWLAGRTERGAASGICRGRTAGAAR